MYPWVVFLHVASAFLFMLAHGATAAVMFVMQKERKPERLRGLLIVRDRAQLPVTITSSLMFLSGIALGFMGSLWGRGWIWTALVLLIAISAVMGIVGRNSMEKVKSVLGEEGTSFKAEALDLAMTSGKPMLLAIVGIGGFLFILWLMMFKPF